MADCDHPIHAGGMCAICGVVLSDAQTSGSISMMHDTESVTVSRQEAQRLDSQSTTHLLDQRKLALIVDLDQTIIHATVDPTVGEWLRDSSNPNFEALRGVGSFRLGMDGKAVLEDGTGVRSGAVDASSSSHNGEASTSKDAEGCWYYVKPRPGLSSFLRTLSEKYELHVYTMGTRSYADCVCKLVDPDGSLFGTRILSRDENGSLVQKSLTRLFPMDTSMVVIIDDRGDVWQWSPNLIKVIPYDFFLGSGDINGGFLPAQIGLGAHPPQDPAVTVQHDGGTPRTLGSSASPEPSSAHPSLTEKLNDAAEKETEERQDIADQRAKAKAEQSQKIIVSEQLGSRPLARMQEQLDERLGVTSSGTSTPRTEASRSADTLGQDAATGSVSSQEDAEAHADTLAKAVSAAQAEIASSNLSGLEQAHDSLHAQPQRSQALLKDDDTELDRLQSILETIHSRWYSRWDATLKERSEAPAGQSDPAQAPPSAKPTVVDIISELKKDVLRNCELVFSSLIPLGGELEDSDYFWMAIEYGASCSKDLKKETTHLVAAKNGTAKVNAAQRQSNVQVVWPMWLHDSIACWSKQPEEHYRLPKASLAPGADETVIPSSHPTDDELSLSEEFDFGCEEEQVTAAGVGTDHDGSDGRQKENWTGHELDGMNWEEADKELEEYLNGSDDDDFNYDTDGETGYGTDESFVVGVGGTRRRSASKDFHGKRSRRSTPSANGDGPSQLTPSKAMTDVRNNCPIAPPTPSALGKRRRVYVLGEGFDETVTAGDIHRSVAVLRSCSNSIAFGQGEGEGDESNASLLRDLEDEIEAALEDEGGGGTVADTTSTTGSATNSVAGGD